MIRFLVVFFRNPPVANFISDVRYASFGRLACGTLAFVMLLR